MKKTGKETKKKETARFIKKLPGLKRIEGQVRGVQNMIETERECLDITYQLSAIINALRRVRSDILHDHLAELGETFIVEDISPKKRKELVEQFKDHIKQLP